MARGLDNAQVTDMTNNVTSYEMAVGEDPASGDVTIYPEWIIPLGYYQSVPELQSIIDKKAFWVVGKGYKAKNEKSKRILENIRGDGKDNINSMMHNMVKTFSIGGDYFAEILRKNGKIVNLKNLNPGSMRIICDAQGFIKRYEQYNPTDSIKKTTAKFKPEDIFHLSFNRYANSHIGTSSIKKLYTILEALKETQTDLKIIFHRYVKPLLLTKVDSDDETEIRTFKAKLDSAVENGENMVVPKNTVDTIERVSIPQYSSLDPMPWLQYLEKLLIMSEGVPGVILGSSEDTTEATAKIVYLAFQQTIEWNQLYLETEFKNQLDLELELEFPASLEMSDSPKANPPKKDNQKSRKLNNMEMSPNTSVR